MFDDVLISLLSATAPQLWRQTASRYEAVRGFLSSDRSAESLDHLSGQLGIRRRQFLRLVKNYELAQAGSPRIDLRPRRNIIDQASDALIRSAIAELGPNLTHAKAYRLVRKRCLEFGVPVPSDTSIRTRSRHYADAANLPALLGLNAGVIVDDSSLDIADGLAGDFVQRCHIVVAFDIATGQALSHRVVSGLPNSDIYGAVVDEVVMRAPLGPIVATSRAHRAIAKTPAGYLARYQGNIFNDPHPGKAICGVFGEYLGRIHLHPRLSDAPIDQKKIAPIALVDPVVSNILDRHNQRSINTSD